VIAPLTLLQGRANSVMRSPTQVDTYRIFADRPRTYRARLTNLHADYDLYVCGPQHEIIASSVKEGVEDERVEFSALDTTNFQYHIIVKVDQSRGVVSQYPYTLELEDIDNPRIMAGALRDGWSISLHARKLPSSAADEVMLIAEITQSGEGIAELGIYQSIGQGFLSVYKCQNERTCQGWVRPQAHHRFPGWPIQNQYVAILDVSNNMPNSRTELLSDLLVVTWPD
jgi:hypothetical protein